MRRIGQLRLTTIVILAACAAAQSPSPSPAPSANATDLIVNQFPLPAYLINSQASNVVVDWNHVRFCDSHWTKAPVRGHPLLHLDANKALSNRWPRKSKMHDAVLTSSPTLSRLFNGFCLRAVRVTQHPGFLLLFIPLCGTPGGIIIKAVIQQILQL